MVQVKRISAFIITFLFIITTSAQAASISGTVKYEGAVPNLKPINMDADPVCAGKHTDSVLPEVLVLGDGNTMANIFVQVKGVSGNYSAPAEPVVLDQAGCQYSPHVFGVMAGQPIKILNPDGTLHNVHALSKVNPEFNMAMPKFRKEVVKTFDQVESIFPIKCDVHPWMQTWCAVMSHPFFDVTEKDGAYSIDGLDPGTYEVEAWHEKLGTKTQTVTVGADGATADFTFSRP